MSRGPIYSCVCRTVQDFEYAVRQGSAVERQVGAWSFPAHIAAAMASLGNAMYSQRQRAQMAFRQIDVGLTG